MENPLYRLFLICSRERTPRETEYAEISREVDEASSTLLSMLNEKQGQLFGAIQSLELNREYWGDKEVCAILWSRLEKPLRRALGKRADSVFRQAIEQAERDFPLVTEEPPLW